MITGLFPQTVIAIIWDFDKTLTPTYMQTPLFEHFRSSAGITVNEFFDEVNRLKAYYKKHNIQVLEDTLYLNRILTYVQSGKLPHLNNRMLRELGARIAFYPGMPGFLRKVKDIIEKDEEFAKYRIEVENYIISTGLKEMIEGSEALKREYGVEKVWGCTFIEEIPPVGFQDNRRPEVENSQILQIGYAIDNTSKTRAVFEINKGTNKIPDIDVNASIKKEKRRVPFENMIYVADGPSDIPVFSIIRQYEGKTYAVYDPNDEKSYADAYRLRHEQDRVDAFGKADYTDGSDTYRWIVHSAKEIAKQIAQRCERSIEENVKKPPVHLAGRIEKMDRGVPKRVDGEETVPERAREMVRSEDDRHLTLEEFISSLEEAGLKLTKEDFRRSYDALTSCGTKNQLSWKVLRGKVTKLRADLKAGQAQPDLIEGKVKELKAARGIPLTPDQWENY